MAVVWTMPGLAGAPVTFGVGLGVPFWATFVADGTNGGVGA